MRAEVALAAGHYRRVVAELAGRGDLSMSELGRLGLAELALGQHAQAELHLLRAHLAGVTAASLGYVRLLLETGRTGAARRQLTRLGTLPGLSAAEGQHLLARCDLADRQFARAAERAEAAGLAYLQHGHEIAAAAPLTTLADACAYSGQPRRAEAAYRLALTVLPEVPDPAGRLRALCGLLWVLGAQDQPPSRSERSALLAAIGTLRARCEEESVQLTVLATLTEVRGWQGDRAGAQQALTELVARLPPGSTVWPWVAVRLAQTAFQTGDLPAAHLALPSTVPQTPEVCLVRAQLHLRLGEQALAQPWLTRAEQGYAAAEQPWGQAATHLARLPLQTGDDHLEGCRHVLDALLANPYPALVQGMCAAVTAALSGEPGQTLPAGLVSRLEAVRRWQTPAPDRPSVRLQTLGGAAAWLNDRRVTLPVPLLACLLLDGEQSRAQLEARLYPERTPSAAASAVKQDIYRARQVLGEGAVCRSAGQRGPTYRPGDLNWELDITAVLLACPRLDAVQVFACLRGEFLPGRAGDWAEDVRVQLALAVGELVETLVALYAREDRHESRLYLLGQYRQAFPPLGPLPHAQVKQPEADPEASFQLAGAGG